MNERLTIQDLTDLLAAKHSMTKKDAEAFVKEFFLLIEQALENEKTVKIKGLGTFKLIDVDSRESVNVNTGERFQIKGHTKVSFSPDTNLRDTINKPFAHFETVVLNENTILEDTPIEDTEEEEVEEETSAQTVLNEVGEGTALLVTEEYESTDDELSEEELIQEEQITAQPSVKDSIEESVIIENVSTVEESIEPSSHVGLKETSTETDIEEKVEQLKDEEVPEEEVAIAEQEPAVPIIPSAKKETIKPVKLEQVSQPTSKKTASVKEKSPIPYLIAVIVIVLLLCGGVILFIYYPDLFSSSPDKNALDMPPITTQPVQPETQLSDTIEQKDTIKEITPDAPKVVTPTSPVAQKEGTVPAKAEPQPAPRQPATSVYLDSASYKITGTKTKYTIKEGETLTKVSLRFYGTKAMWPYIVKHNPKAIKNPNNVPYGTIIEIPELTKE
ncbi:HU family DNA-binding protein [Bacteroides caecimuris]|jgi:nucleoid DNA-binding protein|uniref:Integration host factor n=1 Tax=Bacteroides caecimuris TaxID=1796613 RepID=A0A1C7H1B2_9BACE|nr:HU family DNA-binding protein [Bacteroides caecimuris]ANU57570.1 integration host factor [Bacteroides caecimuris]OXE60903.1 HU family DNA-binding protein [Bacteroides caecimuris]QQR17553.1 HU family DNA-binding protein [Bacteroides caecimuris]UQA30545.1 HU family DNA-binding protein [Bacteroides caecimuris]